VKKEIKIGPITILLPDEMSNRFTIFEDLAYLFNTSYQSDAVSLLKFEIDSLELKPRPSIDYESDFTQIDSVDPKTIFNVAKVILKLSKVENIKDVSEEDFISIYTQLKSWKKPSKQKWRIGDILSVPLINKNFAFGQIIGMHSKNSPILALLDIVKAEDVISKEETKNLKFISAFNSDGEEINSFTYKILFNCEVLVDPQRVKNKNSIGGATLSSIANAYYGLEPWNVMANENYFADFLLPEIPRPKNVIILNHLERIKYRKEKFNIDENNCYIK
jgi:hypothetical protein